jgi:hypothetical protein
MIELLLTEWVNVSLVLRLVNEVNRIEHSRANGTSNNTNARLALNPLQLCLKAPKSKKKILQVQGVQ